MMEIPEGEKREMNRRNIWNNNAENFPKLMSDTKLQIQEAQKTAGRINDKNTILNHIIFELQKITD